jgi:hypothetical protein
MSWDNHKFRWSGLDDFGGAIIIEFIPGLDTNLSSPTVINFPDKLFHIKDKIEIDEEFDNNVLLGFPKTPVCKLKVNLSTMVGEFATGENWYNIVRAIMQGFCLTPKTVLGTGMYIPNLWRITRDSEVIFEGVQNMTPSQELEVNQTDEGIFYEINLSDSLLTCLKLLKPLHFDISEIWNEYTVPNGNGMLISELYSEHYVNPPEAFRARVERDPLLDNLDDDHKMIKLSYFWGTIQDNLSTVYSAICREPKLAAISLPSSSATTHLNGDDTGYFTHDYSWGIAIGTIVDSPYFAAGTYVKSIKYNETTTNYDVIFSNSTVTTGDFLIDYINDDLVVTPYNHHKWYAQTLDRTSPKTTQILPSDMYFMGSRYQLSTGLDVAGFLCKTDQSGLYSYNSIYDFMNAEIYAKGCKVLLDYNATTSLGACSAIRIYKMLDSDILPPTISLSSIKSDKSNIKMNVNIVSKTISQISSPVAGDIVEYPSAADTDTIIGTTDNDNTQTLKHVFNSQPLAMVAENQRTIQWGGLIRDLGVDLTRTLFRWDGYRMIRLSHLTDVFAGTAKYIEKTTTNNKPVPAKVNDRDWMHPYNTWINAEKFNSFPHCIAKLVKMSLGDPDNSLFTCTLEPNTLIYINDCGNAYIIDLDTILSGITLPLYHGNMAYITKRKHNVFTREDEVSLFIPSLNVF